MFLILCLCPQNILELKVYDENEVTKDELLFTVLFDVAKIQLGETVLLTFQLNSKVRNKTALATGKKYISDIPSLITSWETFVGGRGSLSLACT